MKRIILNVVVMLLTFAFGALFGRMAVKRAHENGPVHQHVYEMVATELKPATPEALPPSAPTVTPTPHLILDYDPKKFTLSGYFKILGPKPKEFEDFHFELELFEGEDGRPSGYLSAVSNSEDSYEASAPIFAFVTERRLLFVTSPGPNSRVEYRFDGEFLRKDFEAVAEKNKAVIRGRLTKIKNGRKVAERVVSFRMYELHGC